MCVCVCVCEGESAHMTNIGVHATVGSETDAGM